jgi:hypothetical protein
VESSSVSRRSDAGGTCHGNADIPAADVILFPEEDHDINDLGIKGISELGNVGTNAAVANAFSMRPAFGFETFREGSNICSAPRRFERAARLNTTRFGGEQASKRKGPATQRHRLFLINLGQARCLPALCAVPGVNIALDLIPRLAVALLDLAFELVATSVDDVQVIVGELAPPLLDFALDLLPVSFNAVPIHDKTSQELIPLPTSWGESSSKCEG